MGAKIWQLLQKGVPEEQVIDNDQQGLPNSSRDSGQRRARFHRDLEKQKLIVSEVPAKVAG